MSDVVGGLLRHLMTVALQRQYNWFGHKGKKEFGKLNLAAVVCSKYNCGYYCESTLTVLLVKHIEQEHTTEKSRPPRDLLQKR